MKITLDTNLDELLELWVNYSQKLIEIGDYDNDEVEELKKLRETLVKKGIEALAIDQIDDANYTIRYTHKGNLLRKKIAVK